MPPRRGFSCALRARHALEIDAPSTYFSRETVTRKRFAYVAPPERSESPLLRPAATREVPSCGFGDGTGLDRPKGVGNCVVRVAYGPHTLIREHQTQGTSDTDQHDMCTMAVPACQTPCSIGYRRSQPPWYQPDTGRCRFDASTAAHAACDVTAAGDSSGCTQRKREGNAEVTAEACTEGGSGQRHR